MTSDVEELNSSNLTQIRRVINTVVTEGSPGLFLLLDGFVHTENCSSLWKFDDRESDSNLEIDTFVGGESCMTLSDTGVEIYLFGEMTRGKLLALNEELGRAPDQPPKELDMQEQPFVHAIYEHRLLTAKLIRAGRRNVKSARDPEFIPADRKGMTKMLSSLLPALVARARGAGARKKGFAANLLK